MINETTEDNLNNQVDDIFGGNLYGPNLGSNHYLHNNMQPVASSNRIALIKQRRRGHMRTATQGFTSQGDQMMIVDK